MSTAAVHDVHRLWTTQRARHGVMEGRRTPAKGYVVALLALAEKPRYTAEIVARTGENQGNLTRYMRNLDQWGFITLQQEIRGLGSQGGGWPAKVYRLTFKGLELATALTRAGAALPSERTKARARAVMRGGLSDREAQCLGLIAAGTTNARIGTALGLSEDTIKTHLRRLYSKLGAHDRAHAVSIGYQRGLLRVESARAA